MFCIRELCPEGPCYVYCFALDHVVNGRTPHRQLIVKAVAPLKNFPLGIQLAALKTQQREAEDIQPHTHRDKCHLKKYYWNTLELSAFFPTYFETFAG